MTEPEIKDTILSVREEQETILLNLGTWLRSSTPLRHSSSAANDAALARLKAAREKEAKLFEIILHVDCKPGFQKGHRGYRKKAQRQQLQDEGVANES